jgi:hypothetical protein
MSTDWQRSRRAKKRTYNTRLIKRDYSYFVWEIAELFDLHPNAVRRWLKAGLVTLDDRRPILVHGSDLIDFLDMRQAARKQKCAVDQFYCFRCRRPRHPRFGYVEAEIRSEMRLDLSGACDTCGTRMHRAGSVARLEEYRKAFTIQTLGEGRIRGRFDPTVMCHLSEE